jgi:protein-S-isoprenylcysteine O-methyltransferase Ste14
MTINLFNNTKIKKDGIRWLVRESLGNVVLIAILFGIVGRWDWWMGWTLSGIYIFWTVSTSILILPINPQMLAERARPHPDIKKWDKVLLGLMGITVIAEYFVASLDVRWSWSAQVPLIMRIFGLVIAVFGYDFLLVKAMVTNSFFVTTVRIQNERNHKVISNGIYKLIRHPGYLGTILLYVGVPLMLNSLWAFIPASINVLLLVFRTKLGR